MNHGWPRRLINYPIILIAVVQQLIIGFGLLWDFDSRMVTAVHALYQVALVPALLPYGMIAAAMLSVVGFFMNKKIITLICMLPQQLLLYIAAGGSFRAIWFGHFADGVERTHIFILSDQAPSILIAVFHTWGMILIMLYGEQEKKGKRKWFGFLAF